jgi:hypothetical protein
MKHAFSSEPSLARSASAFEASLVQLDNRVDWIPVGWQPLFGDLRRALRGIAHRSRDNLVIEGAFEEDGLLYVDCQADDEVVQGLLRKARARAKHTCVYCGRRGRRRELDNWRETTLCGACAGPRLLQLELRRVLALDRCGTIVLHDELRSSRRTVLLRAAMGASRSQFFVPAVRSDEERTRAWLRQLSDRVDRELHG